MSTRRTFIAVAATTAFALAACGSDEASDPVGDVTSSTDASSSTEPQVTEPSVDASTSTVPPITAAPEAAPVTEPPPTVAPVTAPPAPVEAVFAPPPGMAAQLSTVSFDETVANAVAAIGGNPELTLLAQIDHAANAVAVGLELRPTTELIFGNPTLGTPLMQFNPVVGIDLPQKLLIMQDASGNVGVFWNKPGYLAFRHQLDVAALGVPLATTSDALKALAAIAAASAEPPIDGQPAPGPGLPPLLSASAVGTAREAADRLRAAIEANPDLTLVAEIDHTAYAVSVGLELSPIIEVIFGNPAVGTPMMQASQTIGIDLPQKMLFVESEGSVQIVYNDPVGIAGRHGVDPALPAVVSVSAALAELAAAAVG